MHKYLHVYGRLRKKKENLFPYTFIVQTLKIISYQHTNTHTNICYTFPCKK